MGLTTLFFLILPFYQFHYVAHYVYIYTIYIPYHDNSMEAGSNQWPWQEPIFVVFVVVKYEC